MQFYDDKSDIDWVFHVHLPDYEYSELHSSTKCIILHGNEDSPDKLEVFDVHHYQAIPAVFIQDSETGNLIKE